jgi:hypothetical protein
MKHYTNYTIPATQNGMHYVHHTEDTNFKKYKFLSLVAWDVAYSRACDIQEKSQLSCQKILVVKLVQVLPM